MKFYYNSIKLFAVSMLVATNFSCSSDDDSSDSPVLVYGCTDLSSVNYDANANTDDGSCVTTPDSYVFERGGETTVSYGGQTARLDMAASLFGKLNDENVSGADLLQMFEDGTGFTADNGASQGEIDAIEALNNSGKKLGNKTAAYGDASVQPKIAGFLTEYADNVSTNFNVDASVGVAGSHTGSGGRTVRINEKGMELNQVFAKSLIGALVMDQVAYGYLSEVKIGDDVDNDASALGAGEYTTMEHHFDEGLGYVYGQESDITTAATPQGNGILFNNCLLYTSPSPRD